MLKEIPPDEIYVIPVRLDNIIPPYEELQALYYADFFPSYSEGLLKIRRALELSGGIDTNTTNLTLSKDAERIRLYREVFDRPAFKVPCIFEGELRDVDDAIQDISASIVTGKVYSRNGRLLLEIPRKSEFESEQYQSTLNDIHSSLPGLQRTVANLSRLLSDAAGITVNDFEQQFHYMEFFLRDLIAKDVQKDIIINAFELMDVVDSERNAILKKLNFLLTLSQSKTLPYIVLSTVQLKRSEELERDNYPRFTDFYLMLHKELRAFLESGAK